MKYIVMCGGEYPSWETPRQLTRIRGETVIGRTVRLLKEMNVPVYISATDERFAEYAPLLKHDNPFSSAGEGAWVTAFYPTDEPACYLMGDVVFSPHAIREIVRTDTDSIMFFASVPPFSGNYIKKYAEPFAFKVVDQKRFRAAIDFCRANVHTGIFTRHPIAWELWAVINGTDVRQIDYKKICAINDYTCDIDRPEDARKIEAILCRS